MFRIVPGLLALTSFLSAAIAAPNPVPEPSTYLLMGEGLGLLVFAHKKFGKKK